MFDLVQRGEEGRGGELRGEEHDGVEIRTACIVTRKTDRRGLADG
jgi:hypothetical protein